MLRKIIPRYYVLLNSDIMLYAIMTLRLQVAST